MVSSGAWDFNLPPSVWILHATRNVMWVRRLTGVVGAGAVLLLLSAGCAGQDEIGAPSEPTQTVAAPQDRDPRWTDPPSSYEELRERQVVCLRERGWPVSHVDDTLVVNNPPEQTQRYIEDSGECYEAIGANDVQAPDLTPEFAQARFDETVEFHACLTAAGFDVPELPSYEAYEEALLIDLEVYDLASLASITYSELQETDCTDPLTTWGMFEH